MAKPSTIRQMASDYAAAWTSRVPEAVASFYAEDGQIDINGGAPMIGRAAVAAVAAMAAGFYAAFPDLVVHCDDVRMSGDHAVFVWTLEGHHAGTKNFVKLGGWEEWDLTPAGLIGSSRGWFDQDGYEVQIAGRQA